MLLAPTPPTDEPNMFVLWAIALGAVFGLIFLLWLNHKIATRGQPKSETTEPTRVVPRSLTSASPTSPRPSIADVIMSRLWGAAGPAEDSARGLAQDLAKGLHPIATPRKPANEGLALGGLGERAVNDLGDITPAEARAIIRQQARAEAIVAILKAAEAGKVKSAGDQAGLIEAVAGGARTSRPGTPYMALKVIVEELRGKSKPVYYDDLRQKIEAEPH